MNRPGQSLQQLPLQLGGLALGIASLGLLLGSQWSGPGGIQQSSAAIASVLLFVLLIRFALYPRRLWDELRHPALGSIAPAFTMTLMSLSPTLQLWSPSLATMLWLGAIALHFLLLGIFAWYRLRHFRFADILPSWFIPPIGFVVAVITSPDPQLWRELNLVLFYLGLANFVLLLPLMLNRLILGDKLAENARATMGVLAAPASLCLAAYLVLYDQPAPLLVLLLFGVALLMTLVVYLSLFHLLRLPFTPALIALTFPLVISARALYETCLWLEQTNLAAKQLTLLHKLAIGETVIATMLVTWVTIAFVRHYWPQKAPAGAIGSS